MDEDTLEKFYREGLEERLIGNIAKEKGISLEEAMDRYRQESCAKLILDKTAWLSET